MYQVFNVGKTILLDGKPLSLVTPAGVEGWIEKGIPHSYRYDQVRDPLDGQMKYRCAVCPGQRSGRWRRESDPV